MRFPLLIVIIGLGLNQCERIEDSPIDDIDIEGVKTIDVLLTGNDSLMLDFDLDNEIDLVFRAIHQSNGAAYSYSLKCETYNDYEVAIQQANYYKGKDLNEQKTWTVDTISINIPKMFWSNDTINDESNYGGGSIDIAIYSRAFWSDYEFESYASDWLGSDNRYMGFRNKSSHIYGWVKIGATSYDSISILSSQLCIDSDVLVINE